MHTEDRYVLEALRVGIKGYVIKTQAAEDLVRAIQEVQAYLLRSGLLPETAGLVRYAVRQGLIQA